MRGVSFGGDGDRAEPILESVRTGRALFVLVLSYTRTAEIPGITVAGAGPSAMKYTPPADAEYIQYGECRCMPGVPVTPDGKPTPALLTRVALRLSGIPHMVIDAGGLVSPRLPHMSTGIGPGNNIETEPAMTRGQARRTITHGRHAGGLLSALCDCIIIGESVPGGTTTALATMRGLNLPARVSSSMPENPVAAKERAVRAALGRLGMDDYVGVAAQVSDPMIPFVSAMLSAASGSCNVILAGGTQMLAVLALASKMGFECGRTAMATTKYVYEDPGVGFAGQASAISPVPVASVDPGLERSAHGGLRSYARGFAKEGAGAGGALLAAAARLGVSPPSMLPHMDREYSRIF